MKTTSLLVLLLSLLCNFTDSYYTDLSSNYDAICYEFRQGPGSDDIEDFYDDILDDLDDALEEAEETEDDRLTKKVRAASDLISTLNPGNRGSGVCANKYSMVTDDLGIRLTKIDDTGCATIYHTSLWGGKHEIWFGQNDNRFVVTVTPYFKVYNSVSDYGFTGIGSGLLRTIFQITEGRSQGYRYLYHHIECEEGVSGYYPCDY